MNTYRYRIVDQLGSLLRGSPVAKIKRCLRLAEQHGIPITATELEAHHLAGGRITDLLDALVYAAQHHLTLSLHRATVQDVARGNELRVTEWVAERHRHGITDLDHEPIS